MKQNINRQLNQKGFTLVELMVTLVVAFIVIGAIYASYRVQQQNSTIQRQVTEIQQNLRAGIEVLSRDFRVAGYDPTDSGEYGITLATQNTFQFTADLCEDGALPKVAGACAAGPFAGQVLEETYVFQLIDTNGDGTNDAISRTAGGPQVTVAENIERLEFHYVRADNTVYGGTPPATEYPNIRAVIVTLIGRSSEPDFKYTNTIPYVNGFNQQLPLYNDNFRRRILVKRIELRNAGLI